MADTERTTDVADAGKAIAVATRRLPEKLAELQGDRLYRAIGLLFLLALLFSHFDPISRVLLIAFLSIILAVALHVVVQKLPLSRTPALIIALVLTLGGIGVSLWLGVSALIAQFRQLVNDFPAIVEGAEQWLDDKLGMDVELLGPRSREVVESVVGGSDTAAMLSGAFGFLELLALVVLVLVGAFYLVFKPNDQLLTPLIRAIPRQRRPAFRRMFKLMGERLAGWLWGTVILCGFVGVASVVAFYLLGTPYPLLLGVLVGVTNIIPIVGPWIGGLIAIAVTLFAEPMTALWVALAILVIQQVEGDLIRPLVMSGSAQIHPFVTLLALLLFSSIFGILGAVLSLPLALAVGTIIEVLWVEETLKAADDEIAPVVDTT
ncbi:MAG TPA: AI-2E family transporter [Longimicrobiales bacterium]|nr:AI-2E family transporter [Longimicrobiales bacterium]